MDIKWLEDFISLARTRSFSRAAKERHVTQSAFSRRIQALETWLGVSLIDRSTYPTALTAEGRQFHETAEEAVRMLHASRYRLQSNAGPVTPVVTIAALHTLSISFFPRWFRKIEAHTGPLGSRLLSEDFHGCLLAIVEGTYDFLLMFHHQSAPVMLAPEVYPYLVVGTDSLVAVRSTELAGPDEDQETSLPLLTYERDSFLGRVTAFAQMQAGAPPVHVMHIDKKAMAEGLKTMVLEGHGLAWLPRSLVAEELREGRLAQVGQEIPLEIRLYRNARRTRAVVDSVWTAVQAVALEA